MSRIPKPEPDEYLAYYGKYIALVATMRCRVAHASGEHPRLLEGVNDAQAMFRYAPGKWSVKEVLGHIMDGERVFGYRALRFARADHTRCRLRREHVGARGGSTGARCPSWWPSTTPCAPRRWHCSDRSTTPDSASVARRTMPSECARAGPHHCRTQLHHVSLLKERYGSRERHDSATRR